MARKFLYVVAVLIVFAIGARLAYQFYGNQMMRWAMTPAAAFEAQPAPAADAYADPKLWLARPDKPGNAALWLPPGVAATKPGAAAIFFVHPTSYLDKSHWNAPLDDADANGRAALFLQGQASAFSAAGEIWAPRYRQATFGAFLTDEKAAQQALDLAYRDVDMAFTQFLKEAGDRPIILAGHSQGALHIARLLRDRVANTPLAKRIVAAYVVGWPVSRTVDLPRMGLPECTRAGSGWLHPVVAEFRRRCRYLADHRYLRCDGRADRRTAQEHAADLHQPADRRGGRRSPGQRQSRHACSRPPTSPPPK